MSRRQNSGFSLISAIFLLVVVAVLGAYVATLATSQQTSEALDVEGARAYQAARAGIEWGAWQLLQNSGGAFATACDAADYATGTSPVLSALAGTLSGFNVVVKCGSQKPLPFPTEGIATVRVYQLTVTASKGNLGSLFYVERQLQAILERDG
jgi:MSHA biogenesis protein MshP